MKRILALTITLVCFTLTFTSCVQNRIFIPDEQLADATVEKIITAVKNGDVSDLTDLLSKNVQQNAEMQSAAEAFIEFIEGDIVSYTKASEHGVGAYEEQEARTFKRKKWLNSTFTVKTTEGIYHIAIYECVRDDHDEDNIGIFALYIINEDDWNSDYYYRVNGDSPQGIHIE